MDGQSHDVGKNRYDHPLVVVVWPFGGCCCCCCRRWCGRRSSRRRQHQQLCRLADASAATCRTVAGARCAHYAGAYVRFVRSGRGAGIVNLLVGRVAIAAGLFVPQIAATVGVPLHTVQLLASGRQFAPLRRDTQIAKQT